MFISNVPHIATEEKIGSFKVDGISLTIEAQALTLCEESEEEPEEEEE